VRHGSLRQQSRRLVRQRGYENLSVEALVSALRQHGSTAVPVSVKRELVEVIKAELGAK